VSESRLNGVALCSDGIGQAAGRLGIVVGNASMEDAVQALERRQMCQSYTCVGYSLRDEAPVWFDLLNR
jgi:hypothetical protein